MASIGRNGRYDEWDGTRELADSPDCLQGISCLDIFQPPDCMSAILAAG